MEQQHPFDSSAVSHSGSERLAAFCPCPAAGLVVPGSGGGARYRKTIKPKVERSSQNEFPV